MGGTVSKSRKHAGKAGNMSQRKPSVVSSIRKKQKRHPVSALEQQRYVQQTAMGNVTHLESQLNNLSLRSDATIQGQISQSVNLTFANKSTKSDANGNLTTSTVIPTNRKKKGLAPKPPPLTLSIENQSDQPQLKPIIMPKPNLSQISQSPQLQTKRKSKSKIKPSTFPKVKPGEVQPLPNSYSNSIDLISLPQRSSKHVNNLERFKISPDLITRLQKFPQFTSIPFGIAGIKQVSTTTSTFYTTLPFVPPFDSQPQKRWSAIQQALANVSQLCQQGHKAIDIIFTTISTYTSNGQNESNFGMLNRPDLEPYLQSTLPIIAEQALQLVHLLEQPIPYLTSGESKTLFLNRKLCCSLLANAFFCTYLSHSLNDMPDINFFRLFNDTKSDRCEVKKEKLKCILNYFHQMHQTAANQPFQQQIISFERRCMHKKTNWDADNHQLCKISIEPEKKIEQADNMLQIDFANRMVGGGVLNDGSVMEEIRFSTCPELIVSRLFTQALDHDEVLVVTGTETFSKYTGYSTSFTYNGPTATKWGHQLVDNIGRTYTQLVTMDATYFKRNDIAKQFRKKHIDRDLHKCKVAFQHGKAAISPIATGNWGCGAFNGNPELKFIIQWMAASHQDRPLMQYHINGNHVQGQSILDMSTFLIQRNAFVGQIYQVVLDYSTDVIEQQLHNQTTLFSYIKYRFDA